MRQNLCAHAWAPALSRMPVNAADAKSSAPRCRLARRRKVQPFNELTRLGRLRRMRRLGCLALTRYGLAGYRLRFLKYEGNIVFLVRPPDSTHSRIAGGPDRHGRYILRIHTTRKAERIASELKWLAALRKEAGLPVPEPVPTPDGELFVTLPLAGSSRTWHVSLMHWLKGRRLDHGIRPGHARAWGKALGRLHKFAAEWNSPEGFARPYLGWSGLYGQDGGLWYPAEELVAAMPPRYREPFKIVTGRIRKVMEDLGEGPDAYGMIHGDMYLENVLFRAGAAYLIDFDDCGFGYWMYDIGVALSQWPWTDEWDWIRDGLLEGYTDVRSLPGSQLAHLDLFMAAQYAVLTLWGTAFVVSNPSMRAEHERWRNRGGDNMLRYLRTR
jgi:Ser/Thr protein kinase RdoA (MazF antagonist)